MDVLIFGVDDDARMPHRVSAGFVDPRVQRRHVDVMDLFIGFYGVVEFDSVGSTSKEGVSGLQGINYLEVEEKLVFVFFFPLKFFY